MVYIMLLGVVAEAHYAKVTLLPAASQQLQLPAAVQGLPPSTDHTHLCQVLHLAVVVVCVSCGEHDSVQQLSISL